MHLAKYKYVEIKPNDSNTRTNDKTRSFYDVRNGQNQYNRNKRENLIFIIHFCSFRMHSMSHEIKITHIVHNVRYILTCIIRLRRRQRGGNFTIRESTEGICSDIHS